MGDEPMIDPDGKRLEIFSQEMPIADAKQYLQAARAVADVLGSPCCCWGVRARSR
jgi:hypothetical protein